MDKSNKKTMQNINKMCKNCGAHITKKYKESWKQFFSKSFCSVRCVCKFKTGKKTGQSSWNKGLSSWSKGKPMKLTTKQKISTANTGKTRTTETKIKLSVAKKGNKHPNWKGGKSFCKYPREFCVALRLKIRDRDNFTCCRCGKTEDEEKLQIGRVLCVNHIDFNKNNNNETNLNTLCAVCNTQINYNRSYWKEVFINNQKQLCKLQKKS